MQASICHSATQKHVIFKILVVEYDVLYPRRYRLLIWSILNPKSRRDYKLPTELNVVAHPKVVGISCCRFLKNINQRCLVQQNARRDVILQSRQAALQNQAHKFYTMYSSAKNTCKYHQPLTLNCSTSLHCRLKVTLITQVMSKVGNLESQC